MKAGSLLALSILTVACASRTKPAPQTAAPQRSVPTVAAGPSTNAPVVVSAQKQKLLRSALISNAFGGCWNAPRHASITADMVSDDGTPYFAPHELAIDLNGDGVPDPVVEVDRDASSVRYELYLKRGNCSQYLGTMRVGGTIIGPLGKANGMRTLEVEELCNSMERPCRDIEHTEVMFDGKGWRPGKRWTTPTP